MGESPVDRLQQKVMFKIFTSDINTKSI